MYALAFDLRVEDLKKYYGEPIIRLMTKLDKN